MRTLFTIILMSLVILPGGSYAANSIDARDQKVDSASNNAEKKQHHPAVQKAAVPIERRTVYGAEQIKKKAEASKESGKRGNAKLNGYLNGFLDGLNGLSRNLSKTEGPMTARQKEKRMSFKERLELELERKQQRNNGEK
ncbi:MAG: hypothetical protein Q9M08_04625 [Mariprofundus sp.]|nr:hypothetical protein [Mariprofundus sp.]